MNARSVSNRARPWSGQLLITMAVLFAPPVARGSDVVLAVRGTLAGGPDGLRIFGRERYLSKGTPFTLVAVFDDSRGSPSQRAAAAAFWRGEANGHRIAPVRAVLTINGRSHTFRSDTKASSDPWYLLKTSCSRREIAFAVVEASSAVSVKAELAASLTQAPDCRSPGLISSAFGNNSLTGFIIGRRNDAHRETRSQFRVQSVVISQRK